LGFFVCFVVVLSSPHDFSAQDCKIHRDLIGRCPKDRSDWPIKVDITTARFRGIFFLGGWQIPSDLVSHPPGEDKIFGFPTPLKPKIEAKFTGYEPSIF
jgi:hypothetical protein